MSIKLPTFKLKLMEQTAGKLSRIGDGICLTRRTYLSVYRASKLIKVDVNENAGKLINKNVKLMPK